MGALLDHLIAFGQARGVRLREDTAVVSVKGPTATLDGERPLTTTF
ncbi:hypothetical protein ACFSC4_05465 [Deinococcus malanensis]